MINGTGKAALHVWLLFPITPLSIVYNQRIIDVHRIPKLSLQYSVRWIIVLLMDTMVQYGASGHLIPTKEKTYYRAPVR